MTSTQTFDSIEYSSRATSAATFKYGFIKVNGQSDYEQKFVYRGNSVYILYTFVLDVFIFEGGVWNQSILLIRKKYIMNLHHIKI